MKKSKIQTDSLTPKPEIHRIKCEFDLVIFMGDDGKKKVQVKPIDINSKGNPEHYMCFFNQVLTELINDYGKMKNPTIQTKDNMLTPQLQAFHDQMVQVLAAKVRILYNQWQQLKEKNNKNEIE